MRNQLLSGKGLPGYITVEGDNHDWGKISRYTPDLDGGMAEWCGSCGAIKLHINSGVIYFYPGVNELNPTREWRRCRGRTGGLYKELHETEQALGIALGCPWYKDDQAVFPGATEADGVFTGIDTTVTLAQQAADKIRELEAELESYRRKP